MRKLLSIVFLTLTISFLNAQVLINEFDTNTSSSEYLELFNTTVADIDLAASGYSLVFYNGSDDSEYQTTALTGTIPANGFFVLAESAASDLGGYTPDQNASWTSFQNGVDAVALVSNGTQVDAIIYGSSADTGLETLLGLSGILISNGSSGSSSRVTDGQGGASYANDDWHITASRTPGSTNEVAPPSYTAYTIVEIQTPVSDSDDASQHEDELVETSGIITAANSYSFYMQDGTADYSGVYVYNSPGTAVVGDNITVTGMVSEYYGFTQISSVADVTINSTGNDVPAATILTTGSLSEAHEGMLVTTSGECTVVSTNAGSDRWAFKLDDGSGDALVDDQIFSDAEDAAIVGSSYDVVGPVNYYYNNFTVNPRDAADIVEMTTTTPGETCADAIAYGAANDAEVTGDLTAGGAVWYTFTSDGFTTTTVSLCGGGTLSDSKLDVYSVCDGTAIGYNDDGCDSGYLSEIEFIDLAAGEYKVLVYGYSAGSVGTFTLSITGSNADPCADLADAQEPNDSMTDATDAAAGGTYTAALCPTTDLDYYMVTAEAGGTISCETNEISGTSYSTDTYLRLFDAAGTELVYNDDGGDGYTSLISYDVTTAGNYYFEVSVSSYAAGDVFDYSADVTNEAAPTYFPSYTVYRGGVSIATDVDVTVYQDAGLTNGTEYCYTVTQNMEDESVSGESDQACATPEAPPVGSVCENPIAYGTVNDVAVSGATVEAYDVAWYSFVLDGDYDDVSVSLCGSGFDTKLEVWGACDDASYLGYNDDYCSTQSQVDLTDLAAGTYHAKVYGWSASFGDYVLEVTGSVDPTGPTLTATGEIGAINLSWDPVPSGMLSTPPTNEMSIETVAELEAKHGMIRVENPTQSSSRDVACLNHMTSLAYLWTGTSTYVSLYPSTAGTVSLDSVNFGDYSNAWVGLTEASAFVSIDLADANGTTVSSITSGTVTTDGTYGMLDLSSLGAFEFDGMGYIKVSMTPLTDVYGDGSSMAPYPLSDDGTVPSGLSGIDDADNPGAFVSGAYNWDIDLCGDFPTPFESSFSLYRDGTLYEADLFGNSFFDDDVADATQYCYTLTENMEDGSVSDASNEACATPIAPVDLPVATDLEASADGYNVMVSWTAPDLTNYDPDSFTPSSGEKTDDISNYIAYDPSFYSTPRQGGETVDDAVAIDALPYNNVGTTVGYTDDYDEVCPYTGSTSPDVVYSFTTDVAMAINVSLCGEGSNYDTKVYVYENEAGSLASTVDGGEATACNDDECENSTTQYLSFLPGVLCTPGNTYYIVVDGYGGGSGDYEIDVVDGTPSPLLGYNVYRDGAMVGMVDDGAATNWGEFMPTEGIYDYYVTALYDIYGESAASNSDTANVVPPAPSCNAPQNLMADAVGNDVTLSWDAPVGGAGWSLHHDSGDFGSAIGTDGEADFSVAARFGPAHLGDYNGMSLTKVQFIPNEPSASYQVTVWTASVDGEPTIIDTLEWIAGENLTIGEYNVVDLAEAIEIDWTSELWFGYRTITATGHPAGTDAGPMVPGFGAKIFWGGVWYDLTDLGATLDYNWAVQGYVDYSEGRSISSMPSIEITMNGQGFNANESINLVSSTNVRPMNTPVDNTSRALTNYIVYRDGSVVDTTGIGATEYSDLDGEWGTHTYYVTALYNDSETCGESGPSNEAAVDLQNTPPSGFNLLSPADGSVISIRPTNLDSLIMFVWTPSGDADGDELEYTWMWVQPGAWYGADTVTTSNTMNISLGYVYDQITSHGDTSGSWMWVVEVTDGVDTTGSEPGYMMVDWDISEMLAIDDASLPEAFALHNNYPNPFNPVTNISFDIPEVAEVTLEIYNVMGQKVRTLAQGQHEPGRYKIQWNATNDYGQALSSGMYIYRIQAGDFVSVKKLVLMK
mgnify:CR=1 FL=1